eukprot:CAMPEP_0183356116 /NCGR_PEP_ID=MMETSP0164_2-20130417/43151_1 /TAXON_ID=221442 /ORGANISM="Coccolithus pelagicus ssp braarudi, Strain PLY182g" /LENGTH=52 /DNA_ID=CAMNT_0025529425 /DNA_START=67 /DNA_END=221 /DNA_ORIENTATION=+
MPRGGARTRAKPVEQNQKDLIENTSIAQTSPDATRAASRRMDSHRVHAAAPR